MGSGKSKEKSKENEDDTAPSKPPKDVKAKDSQSPQEETIASTESPSANKIAEDAKTDEAVKEAKTDTVVSPKEETDEAKSSKGESPAPENTNKKSDGNKAETDAAATEDKPEADAAAPEEKKQVDDAPAEGKSEPESASSEAKTEADAAAAEEKTVADPAGTEEKSEADTEASEGKTEPDAEATEGKTEPDTEATEGKTEPDAEATEGKTEPDTEATEGKTEGDPSAADESKTDAVRAPAETSDAKEDDTADDAKTDEAESSTNKDEAEANEESSRTAQDQPAADAVKEAPAVADEAKAESDEPLLPANDSSEEPSAPAAGDTDEAKTDTPAPTDNKPTTDGPLVMKDVYFTRSWRDALPSMAGKVVAITGTTSGTGYVAAMECARLGAHVLLLNRRGNAAKALKAVRGATSVEDWKEVKPEELDGTNEKVIDVDCDLLSLDSVRTAAKTVSDLVSSLGGLDVLALNAGIAKSTGDSADGFDKCLQANHLSHMLLLASLFPALEAAAKARGQSRVVFHSSAARLVCKGRTIPGETLQPSVTRTWPSDWPQLANNEQGVRYGVSKSANFACFWALHEKLQSKQSKVMSLCATPGFAATAIFDKESDENRKIVKQFLPVSGQSAADGTMPLLTCMVDAKIASGDFYSSDGSTPLTDAGTTQLKGPPEKVTPQEWELSMYAQGQQVWKDTYAALGVDFDL